MRLIPVVIYLDRIAPAIAEVNLVKDGQVVTVNLHELFDSIKDRKEADNEPD